MIRLLLTIVIILTSLGFANCATTGSHKIEDDKLSVDTIKKDFERCGELYGSDREECQDELLKDYARTYNAQPEILERIVLFQNDKFETVRYTIAKHKVVIQLEVQERRASIIGDISIVPFSMGFLAGVILTILF